MDAESMARIAGFSQRSPRTNLEGISHRDALVRPPHGGSCASWIVGHVLVHRDAPGRLGLLRRILGREGAIR